MLHALGTARYGIWILTSSIIGYYGLLDLGFRAGVTQYLTRYLAVGDYQGERMHQQRGGRAGAGLASSCSAQHRRGLISRRRSSICRRGWSAKRSGAS